MQCRVDAGRQVLLILIIINNNKEQIQILSETNRNTCPDIGRCAVQILSEITRNTCPDTGRGAVQGRRRTQLRRPLELKAGAAECSCQLFYMERKLKTGQRPTKYKYEDLFCSRRNMFPTSLRNCTKFVKC